MYGMLRAQGCAGAAIARLAALVPRPTHNSLGGDTPAEIAGGTPKLQTKLKYFRWQTHSRGIYQLPAAA